MTTHGTVELWHASCWDVRDTPVVVVVAAEEPVIAPVMITVPRRRRIARAHVAIAGAFAIAGAVVVVQQAAATTVSSSMVNLDVTCGDESTALRAANSTFEIAPPKPTRAQNLEGDHPVPLDDKGVPLDETYKSLRGWIHPITAAAELFPWSPGRHFGAQRNGIERAECGAGHCGVDLDGPRGRPLVAVASGVIVVAERRELGGDGMSGRYVRIHHEDGTLTSYMHMDEVDDDLQVGDHVEQGQYLGTLGSTAVRQSVPHVHFSLEIPNRHRGDYTNTRFIDPAPFLVRASVAAVPERRHPIKPAF